MSYLSHRRFLDAPHERDLHLPREPCVKHLLRYAPLLPHSAVMGDSMLLLEGGVLPNGPRDELFSEGWSSIRQITLHADVREHVLRIYDQENSECASWERWAVAGTVATVY